LDAFASAVTAKPGKAQTAAIPGGIARPSPDTGSPCGLPVPGAGQTLWVCAACKACNAAWRVEYGAGGCVARSPKRWTRA